MRRSISAARRVIDTVGLKSAEQTADDPGGSYTSGPSSLGSKDGTIGGYLHKRLCTVDASVGGEEVKARAASCRSVAEGLQVVAPHGRPEQLLLGGDDRSPLARQPGIAPQRLLPV